MAIDDVKTTDSLEAGRLKWNSNDEFLANENLGQQLQINNTLSRVGIAELKITNLEAAHQLYMASLRTSDADTLVEGWEFDLSTNLGAGYTLDNGSVQLAVNGLIYNSNTDQTISTDSDFYINAGLTSVIFRNVANTGSLDLISGDRITIHYQRIKS